MFPTPSLALPTTTISVTASSARIAVATGTERMVRVVNAGANTVFVRPGNASVNAAVTDTPIRAGSDATFTLADDVTHIAAIASVAGPTPIYFQTGGFRLK